MATAKFDIRNEALRPVLAGVGVTDLAVEKVRDYVADLQKQLSKPEPKEMREQAVAAFTARLEALTKDAQARRTAIEKRVAELQSEATGYPAKVQELLDDNMAQANAAYADLVKRGESLLERVRRQKSTQDAIAAAETTVAKVKTTATQALHAVEAQVEAVDRAAATKVAPKTTTRKDAGKKAAATTARKTADKKTATARSSAKATGTAAKKTADNASKAVTDAAEKVGD